MKFKMAATAEHSLKLDPMGKVSQNASSLKPLGQFNQTGRPSWISDRHKKPEFCRGLSNDHSWAVWLNCPSGFREEAF
jgi:hypothetical protein